MFNQRPGQARASCPTWLEFGPPSLIMWVTLLLCLCFTCCQVDLKHKFPLGLGLLFFLSFFPTSSCVGFRFLLDVSASSKLFYRRFPVRLFCSYTVQASQKMATSLILEEKREEVQRKLTSKERRRHSKAEGGRGESDRDVLTGESRS